MNFLLKFLMNPKIIMGIVLAGTIGLGGWYIKSIINENNDFSYKLMNKENEVQQLSTKNDSLESQYKTLEQSLIDYQDSLESSEAFNDKLNAKLNSIGDQNAELQECFDRKLPDDVLNSLLK